MTGQVVTTVRAAAYRVPTDAPGPEHLESDGTLEWTDTDLVVVQVTAGETSGLGYTYADPSAVRLVEDLLAPLVTGVPVGAQRESWTRMRRKVRNLGSTGLVAMAISAVDVALWDLAARVAGAPLVEVLGATHDRVPVYGSGGFTSYDDRTLADQLAGWVEAGIPRVKIKVGRDPERDPHRLRVAREAVGDDTALYVDANGAFLAEQAVGWSRRYRAEFGVEWLEEPVTSDDFAALSLVRCVAPDGLDVAAGEYAWNPWDAERLLAARAVDCLQLDVTRCLGLDGFIDAAALAAAHGIDVSAHCAPQLSAHAVAAVSRPRHLEYFHDHVRIEQLLFDGVLTPTADGALVPDRGRAGHGLSLRESDADRFRVA